jgi:hypothetical protein
MVVTMVIVIVVVLVHKRAAAGGSPVADHPCRPPTILCERKRKSGRGRGRGGVSYLTLILRSRQLAQALLGNPLKAIA